MGFLVHSHMRWEYMGYYRILPPKMRGFGNLCPRATAQRLTPGKEENNVISPSTPIFAVIAG